LIPGGPAERQGAAPAAEKPKPPLGLAAGILGAVSAGLLVMAPLMSRRKDKVSAPPKPRTPTPPEVEASMNGSIGANYQLGKELGRGGMGVVFEGRDLALSRRVAIKRPRDEIHADAGERASFLKEARLVAQLDHPNIVAIYAVVEEANGIYLIFEHVEGRTIHDLIVGQGGRGMAWEICAPIVEQVGAAIEHAHAKKILHRDLKPSNIMMRPDGRIKVMDFGIARQAQDSLTRLGVTSHVMGTPFYIAPEAEFGGVGAVSDIYGLGVTFYQMLTGRLPFEGQEWVMRRNTADFESPSTIMPGIPPRVDELFKLALEPDPRKRMQTPGEFIRFVSELSPKGAGR
jgi:serine/threonine-protein kinase